MSRISIVAALALAGAASADVWSPLDFYSSLGNPEDGATQKGGSDWTFRRGAFNGELMTGMRGRVTCEAGFGLWGTPGGDFGFIPNVGPRVGPDEAFDEGTGQYPPEYNGLMVIPGTFSDACLVFQADGPMPVPPLRLKAEMIYGSSDGVLVSVMTRIAGVNKTWLDKAPVPPGPDGYQSWLLFGSDGPTLQQGDRLWIQLNINGGISGDWTNISLEREDCYADCTSDATLDLFDFLCFVNLFNAGDPSADCDGNDTRDLFDFLCFVNQFNAGC